MEVSVFGFLKKCLRCGKLFLGTKSRCSKCLEYHKEWMKKHYSKPETKERAKEYYKNNIEHIKQVKKEYMHEYYKTPEVTKRKHEYDRAYSKKQEVRERNKISVKKYRSKPDSKIKRNLESHRRKAKIKGNGGTIAAKEWKDLCARYDNKCLRCGRGDVKLTLDHVLPISKGGTNTVDNAQPLCGSCNCSKGTKIIDYRINYG